MTPLTDCAVKEKATPPAASMGRMLEYVAWATVATSLLLLHVYVRFSISDASISARQIQRERERLENEARELTVEVLRLQEGERMDQLAAQWGMSPPSPRQIDTVRMPRSLAQKYDGGAWRRPARGDETFDAESEPALARVVAGVAGFVGEGRAYGGESR